MSKYYINEVNKDYTIIEDGNGNMYEYQPDTDKVFIINRYDSDNGEEIKGKIADEIRFLSMKMQSNRETE